jgi:hypothetical protein
MYYVYKSIKGYLSLRGTFTDVQLALAKAIEVKGIVMINNHICYDLTGS